MKTSARPFVLRSIHLPPEMDDQLRQLAFDVRRPKADVIRLFVSKGLRELDERFGSDIDAKEKFFSSLDTGQSDSHRSAIKRDVDAIGRAADEATPNALGGVTLEMAELVRGVEAAIKSFDPRSAEIEKIVNGYTFNSPHESYGSYLDLPIFNAGRNLLPPAITSGVPPGASLLLQSSVKGTQAPVRWTAAIVAAGREAEHGNHAQALALYEAALRHAIAENAPAALPVIHQGIKLTKLLLEKSQTSTAVDERTSAGPSTP